MNKIVASLGMAALGASYINAVAAEEMGAPPSKPWSVSATLRGFYDDNINGVSTNRTSSFGFEVSPAADLDLRTDQTVVKLGYVYSLRYFEKERFIDPNDSGKGTGHDSQSHQFKGTVDHTFNERYSVNVIDSFVIGQEPDLFRSPLFGSTPVSKPVSGDNIHNYGAIVFSGRLTPIIGFEVGYDNSFFDYEDEGFDFATFSPSLSGLFDRIEQTAHVEGNLRVSPQTIVLIGYQYGWINFTANEPISATGPFFMSKDRDNHSHYVYTGVSHSFSPDFNGALRVGARFIEFDAVSPTISDSSPYLNAVLSYTYAPESSLTGGASYDLQMAGIADAQDSQTAVVYLTLRHRIVPKLFGSLTGQFQDSAYVGGSRGKQSDQFYTLGLNFEYTFTRNFSAQVGYNYDKVVSDASNTEYDRNRVYMGVTARY